ncbi:MAG: Panacea domain-containing protein [Terriglobales bacterium]
MAAESRNATERPPAAWAPIRFEFSEAKAAEAAGVLLGKPGRQMPYMRLIKLMYLADRESLHRFGRPIVGGHYVAMKLGPVLSEVLDAIKCERPGAWRDAVERSGYDAGLKAQPEPRLLSKAEISVLEETADLFRRLDQWALSGLAHGLPEWRDPGASAVEIAPEEILAVLQKSEEEIEEIREDAVEIAHFNRLFSADRS